MVEAGDTVSRDEKAEIQVLHRTIVQLEQRCARLEDLSQDLEMRLEVCEREAMLVFTRPDFCVHDIRRPEISLRGRCNAFRGPGIVLCRQEFLYHDDTRVMSYRSHEQACRVVLCGRHVFFSKISRAQYVCCLS